MTQLTTNIVNPDAENWKDKFDNEHENVVRTTESNTETPYTKITFLRLQWIGSFVQAIADWGDKIVWLTFKDNLLWFILDSDNN